MIKSIFTFCLFTIPGLVFSQNWVKKADAPTSLTFPVVVELNGNVHVLGGGAAWGATGKHLRYIPSLNKWDTLAPVPYLAQQPAGAAVNGKIHYCGGGYPNTGTRLNKHYVYHPDSNRWFQAQSLPVATAIHKGVEFEGSFYILSGQPDKTMFQMFDSDSNRWITKKPLPDQNFWYSALVANSEAIYRFGGGGFGAPSASVYKYDKSIESWTILPSLPKGLHAPAGVAMNDSQIFITGGYNSGNPQSASYIFHTKKNLYYPSDSLPLARSYHSLVKADGCYYSIGGNNDADPNLGISLIQNCNPNFSFPLSIFSSKSESLYSLKKGDSGYWLTMKDNNENSNSTLRVFDFYGKNFGEFDTKEKVTFIPLNQTIKGWYILQIQREGQVYIEKILTD